MDFKKSAKEHIKRNGYVKCCACGKELYSYDDFECIKTKKVYTFIHKKCLKLRGDK